MFDKKIKDKEKSPLEEELDSKSDTDSVDQASANEESNPEPESISDPVEDLKRQLDSQNDRYLRLMAEFDNYKKRSSRDFDRLIESANERLIGELVDVRENFERAIKAGENVTELESLKEGMKLIFSKFDAILSKNGLESFAEQGEAFDPQLHDALMKTVSDKVPEDHIAEVFEKGYMLKKRVIKHAKVVVSSGAADDKNAIEC